MKIRTQISLYLAPFILLVMGGVFILNYFIIRQSLTENAILQLQKTEENMHRAAQALLSAAINNYLRGITEKNIEFIEEQYAAFKRGRMTEREAKDKIQIHFNLQTVGDSGYLVAVKERQDHLYLDLHPFLPGSECTDTEGCQAWSSTRHGYVEYNWKNPIDNSYRKKAAYVQEFPEWNWIIGASSYRDEFVNLVDIDELAALIRPIRINKNGYFFVFDENNNVLIHPELSNTNASGLRNSKGESLIELLKANEDGFLTYLWKNPSEQEEQLKYAAIKRLDTYKWYLVATGYLSEVYEPIEYLKNLTIIMVLLSGSALFFLIYRLSRAISTPLQSLKNGVDLFYRDRHPFQWQPHKTEEINVLGNAFSRMSSELNRSMTVLEEKNTELLKSEQEKDKNRLFLDSIINSMPSLIIGVDTTLCVTLWNRQAELVTGRNSADVQGQQLLSVFEELSEFSELLQETIESSETQIHPFTRTDSEGNTHYSEITFSPLIPFGKTGAVIRIDEVTERIEMEQRLRQSQKMDAIGQLAGGVAHDFNNMLSGIVGSAELLQLRVDPKEQRLVKIISEASRRAAELIQKLLAFSRKETIAFAPVNVHGIILDTIDILARTLDKRIRLTSTLKAKSGVVLGDWSQLQNSLLNIGINAGHAMPEGGMLSFTTTTVMLDEEYCANSSFEITPGQFLFLTIQDNGCGIPKENLKRIFEPFFTTRETNKGTGLGLAAVYGAIQQHNGAIIVNSEEGRGTEFSIYLPSSHLTTISSGINETTLQGEGCILIIDDESLVRTTSKSMLERLGYTVLEADNGLKGLELYKQHCETVDLVLLDMIMPVLDGTDCFFQLKEMNPKVKVVISSGFTRDADLAALKEKGLCSFIRKPYTIAHLSQIISQVLAEPD